jgi:hypothetical protein
MNEEFKTIINSLNRNIIIEGDTYSGKTSKILFPCIDNLIEKRENILIFDTKNEYLDKYKDVLNDNNYKTVIINLKEPDKNEGWNPLEYPYELYKKGEIDKSQELIERIGRIIFYDDKVLDPFWIDSANDLFIGLVLGLFSDNKENITLNDVFIKAMDENDELKSYFTNKGLNSIPYKLVTNTILAPSETRGGILATFRQKLKRYVTKENLGEFLSKTTFEFNSFDKPIAYIIMGRSDNLFINNVAQMFIEELYFSINYRLNNKLNFILDNFDSFKCFKSLHEIVNSCLIKNIKVYISTYSYKELISKHRYIISKLFVPINMNEDTIKIINGMNVKTIYLNEKE